MLDLTATAKFVAASEKISTFPNAPPGLIDENTEKIIDAARRELDRGYQGPEELNLRRLQLSGWSVEDLMAHFGITDPTVGSNLFALYRDGKLPVQDLLGAEFTQAIKNLDSEELINNIFQDIVATPDIFEILLGENGVRAWEVARDFTDPTDVSLLTRLSNDLGDRPNLSYLIKTHIDPEGAFDTWNRVSKGESFVAETQFYDVMDELVPPAMDYNFVWIDPKTGEKFTWNAPTSGLKIYSNAPEGTFIIGGFGPDLKFILPQFPTATIGDPKDLVLPDHLDQLNDWISAGFPQPTGSQFNLLNVYDPLFFYVLDKPNKLVTFSKFTDRGGGVFFTYINGPWMDAAVHQNKKILVASDVSNFVYDSVKGTLTGFGKEIHRLEWIHGYRFDPSTTSMVPPSAGAGLPVLTKEGDLDHGFN